MSNSYQSLLIETNSQGGASDSNLRSDPHQDLAQSHLDQLNLPVKTKIIFLNAGNESNGWVGESFKIAQARDLKSQAQYSKAEDEPMVFVICHAEKITIPAQNALLKLLEEPPANTMLVLVAEQSHGLLETIESRCRISTSAGSTKYLVQSTNSNGNDTAEVDGLVSFFQDPSSTGYSDLIDLSEKLKDREIAIKTLQATIHALHDKLQNQSSASPQYLVLSTKYLSEALDSLQKNGNVRLVLENCFFALKKASH